MTKWPAWMTRRRPRKPNRKYLEDYERTVVLQKVREQRWRSFGLLDLMREYPDVFSKRHLEVALKRMARQGHLARRRRTGWWGSVQYEVREDRVADSPTRSAA